MWFGSRLSQITVTHEALISCPIVLLAVFMLTLASCSCPLVVYMETPHCWRRTLRPGNERLLRFSCPRDCSNASSPKSSPWTRITKTSGFKSLQLQWRGWKAKPCRETHAFKPTRVSVDSPLLTYTSCESSIDTQLENCHMPKGSTRFSGWLNQRCHSCRFHRNRRYCRRGRRHHQTVVPSHLPPRRRTLPSRLQVRHTRRQAASTVKTTRAHSNYFSAVLTGLLSFQFFSSSPIYFCCILFSAHVPPETWSSCRGTRRNSVDTFQHFAESFADCY